MAIAATRTMLTAGHCCGMYAGCIGLNWANRTHTRWCWLTGPMANAAGLALVAGMNRRGRLTHQRHGVGITMTTHARRELCVREAQEVRPAMHALGMRDQRVAMTLATVHRVESAPVPPLPTDVAVKTCRVAVWSTLEESQIDFVAIVTRVLFLGVGRL